MLERAVWFNWNDLENFAKENLGGGLATRMFALLLQYEFEYY